MCKGWPFVPVLCLLFFQIVKFHATVRCVFLGLFAADFEPVFCASSDFYFGTVVRGIQFLFLPGPRAYPLSG